MGSLRTYSHGCHSEYKVSKFKQREPRTTKNQGRSYMKIYVMLITAKLDNNSLDAALIVAKYLRNLSPCSALD